MVECRSVAEALEMTTAVRPHQPDLLQKKARIAKMRVVTIANDPARRFRLLWYIVAWACAITFLVIGVGYAGGGNAAIQSNALGVVNTMEGSLHVHGSIMMAIGIFLIYGLNDYRRITWIGLVAFFFYSIWTAVMIFIGGFFNGISWGGPWWYLLTASLSGTLLILAPPLSKNGRRFAGEQERSESV
jgi:hypothetical protein